MIPRGTLIFIMFVMGSFFFANINTESNRVLLHHHYVNFYVNACTYIRSYGGIKSSNNLHTKGREGEIKGIPIVKSETSTRQNPLFNKYAPDDRK